MAFEPIHPSILANLWTSRPVYRSETWLAITRGDSDLGALGARKHIPCSLHLVHALTMISRL
jgi:hypothetical protein